MEQRVNLQQVSPEAYQAVFGLERHIRKTVAPELRWLLKLRASMLNGCAYCVDMHGGEAAELGADPRKVLAVSAWREAPFFTDDERALLALTDAVTRLGEEGVTDEVWDAAVAAFGQDQVVELIVAIGTINVWNRIAVSVHAQAPVTVPA